MEIAPKKPGNVSLTACQIDDLFSRFEYRMLPVVQSVCEGVYTRAGKIRKGEIAIGAEHKAKNIFHVSKGRLALWDNINGMRLITAPFSEISKPGIRRIAIGLEDSEGANIAEVKAETIEDAEREIFKPMEIPAKIGDKLLNLSEFAGVPLVILPYEN